MKFGFFRVSILGEIFILVNPGYNSPTPPMCNCSLDIPCLIGLRKKMNVTIFLVIMSGATKYNF